MCDLIFCRFPHLANVDVLLYVVLEELHSNLRIYPENLRDVLVTILVHRHHDIMDLALAFFSLGLLLGFSGLKSGHTLDILLKVGATHVRATNVRYTHARPYSRLMS